MDTKEKIMNREKIVRHGNTQSPYDAKVKSMEREGKREEKERGNDPRSK